MAAIKLTLYDNSSHEKCVKKNLTEKAQLTSVYLKEDTDIINPTFTFRKFENWKDFNYCKMEWGKMAPRYYFVQKIIAQPGGIIEIQCKPDPGMTWQSYILGLRTMVTRQENKYNAILYDNRAPVPGSRIWYTKSVGTVGENNGSIILTVSG